MRYQGYELLDLGPGVAVEDGLERLMDVGEWIDAIQFAGCDQRGENGPVFSANVVARVERVLP